MVHARGRLVEPCVGLRFKAITNCGRSSARKQEGDEPPDGDEAQRKQAGEHGTADASGREGRMCDCIADVDCISRGWTYVEREAGCVRYLWSLLYFVFVCLGASHSDIISHESAYRTSLYFLPLLIQHRYHLAPHPARLCSSVSVIKKWLTQK